MVVTADLTVLYLTKEETGSEMASEWAGEHPWTCPRPQSGETFSLSDAENECHQVTTSCTAAAAVPGTWIL